jgi:hypothetical protein
MIVDEPKLIRPLRTLDFGVGFYTTTNREQAIQFAHKVTLRRKVSGLPVQGEFVSVYEFDMPAMELDFSLTVLRFSEPDGAWLDYVTQNRRREYDGFQYDIVFGPVANDDVYATLGAYEAGILSKEQTIIELRIKNCLISLF